MHQIQKLKCFLSRLAQSIGSRCQVEHEDEVGAAPTGDWLFHWWVFTPNAVRWHAVFKYMPIRSLLNCTHVSTVALSWHCKTVIASIWLISMWKQNQIFDHNSHDRHGVPDHRPFECLLNNLFGLTSELRVTDPLFVVVLQYDIRRAAYVTMIC